MSEVDVVSDPFDTRYQNTCFYLSQPVPDRWGAFAVLTANNPSGEVAGHEENCDANCRLESALIKRGVEMIPITGSSPNDEHQEPGFGVRCSLLEAEYLAIQFNQLAFYWVDNGHVFLIDAKRSHRIDLGAFLSRIRARKPS